MRRPNTIRPIKLTTTFPEDIRARLDLFLWSEVEGKVPKGAYQQFLIERIREFFETQALDIGEYAMLPCEAKVRGSPATIALLKQMLERSR